MKSLAGSLRHWTLRLAVLPLVLGAAGCTHDSGGPQVQTMTLEIENEAGKVDRSCLSLPVLNGSMSAQNIEVDSQLDVTTKATNEEVELSYTGGDPFEKTYAIEDIEYQEWPLAAEGDDQTYLISLRLGCSSGSN